MRDSEFLVYFVGVFLQVGFCDACKDIAEFLQTYADSNATEVSERGESREREEKSRGGGGCLKLDE